MPFYIRVYHGSEFLNCLPYFLLCNVLNFLSEALFYFFPILLSVCAHFDVQCFDLYSCLDFSACLDSDLSSCLDFSACLDFSICFEFSAMSIKLSELILHIVFATKAPDLPQRSVTGLW